MIDLDHSFKRLFLFFHFRLLWQKQTKLHWKLPSSLKMIFCNRMVIPHMTGMAMRNWIFSVENSVCRDCLGRTTLAHWRIHLLHLLHRQFAGMIGYTAVLDSFCWISQRLIIWSEISNSILAKGDLIFWYVPLFYITFFHGFMEVALKLFTLVNGDSTVLSQLSIEAKENR